MAQQVVNGARLEYRFDGPADGAPLMLSNSLASNLAMWDAQMDALTGAGFRVLRYDSRGMGASEVTPGPYTIEQLAGDAIGLLDALGLDRVHYCGLSKGGMVGQNLGVNHADRFASLVLCDTSAFTGPPDTWEGRITAAREGGMEAVVDATIDRWFTPAGKARLAGDVAEVRRMILDTSVDGFEACCRAIQAMDQRESIKAITTPTLVVVGEDDPGTPVSAAKLIHEHIAGSALEIIPESAHFCNVEQRERFNEVVLDFLNSQR